jgi:hypothetical protein
MKKVLFAAFGGMVVISSIMATSANSGGINSNQQLSQIVRDTVPGRKSDTSRSPKRGTTSMPKIIDLESK